VCVSVWPLPTTCVRVQPGAAEVGPSARGVAHRIAGGPPTHLSDPPRKVWHVVDRVNSASRMAEGKSSAELVRFHTKVQAQLEASKGPRDVPAGSAAGTSRPRSDSSSVGVTGKVSPPFRPRSRCFVSSIVEEGSCWPLTAPTLIR
jgi:hypothetical protein